MTWEISNPQDDGFDIQITLRESEIWSENNMLTYHVHVPFLTLPGQNIRKLVDEQHKNIFA